MRPPVRRTAFLLPPFLLPLSSSLSTSEHRIALQPLALSRGPSRLVAELCRNETIGFRRGWWWIFLNERKRRTNVGEPCASATEKRIYHEHPVSISERVPYRDASRIMRTNRADRKFFIDRFQWMRLRFRNTRVCRNIYRNHEQVFPFRA